MHFVNLLPNYTKLEFLGFIYLNRFLIACSRRWYVRNLRFIPFGYVLSQFKTEYFLVFRPKSTARCGFGIFSVKTSVIISPFVFI